MPPDTPPSRVKKPCRTGSRRAREGAWSMRLLLSEKSRNRQSRRRQRQRLEQPAHVGGAVAGEPFQRGVDGRGLRGRGAFLETGGAGLDSEPAQERALGRRAVRRKPFALGENLHSSEIRMRAEVGLAGRFQGTCGLV